MCTREADAAAAARAAEAADACATFAPDARLLRLAHRPDTAAVQGLNRALDDVDNPRPPKRTRTAPKRCAPPARLRAPARRMFALVVVARMTVIRGR